MKRNHKRFNIIVPPGYDKTCENAAAAMIFKGNNSSSQNLHQKSKFQTRLSRQFDSARLKELHWQTSTHITLPDSDNLKPKLDVKSPSHVTVLLNFKPRSDLTMVVRWQRVFAVVSSQSRAAEALFSLGRGSKFLRGGRAKSPSPPLLPITFALSDPPSHPRFASCASYR